MRKRTAVIKCQVEACTRKASTRGVCDSCYMHARNLVNSGEASWKQLEDMGLVRPAHEHATKNPLKAAFLAASANGRKLRKV